jgi:methylase of polypeptide subunit release factors
MTVLRPAPAFQGPLDSTDLSAVETLGRTLIAHGFASDAVLAALGPPLAQTRSHVRDDVPLYLRRLSVRTPLHTLIKIFVLCQAVDEDAAAEAFAPLSLDDVARLGVIERDDAGVIARVRLSGCSGLLLTHDAYDPRGTTNRDHVLDVNPTTNTLASLTVRRRVRSALDIGTGCGVVALMAARHSDRVVGVDTNPRALNYAVFNAALNGLHNVEFRQGSLFDPVHRERFDLIACNPPYVISPESRYIFRDGDRRGHGLCEEVVRRAPEHLESGGYATILCNWGIGPGEHWSAPLREWVAESTCDTWLLCSGTQDPLTYAAIWNRGPDAAGYREALETWPAYHRELDFEKIGIGAVILRRRSTAGGWVRTDVLPDGPFEPDETLIPRIFDAQDRLAALPSDDALLASACLPTNTHELHQVLTLRDGRYVVRDAEIRLDAGLKFRGTVDPYTTHLLTRCNGQVTLEEIADDIASRASNTREEVRRATATIARRLISLGFLIPVN